LSEGTLSGDDLRFINLVAVRRFGAGGQPRETRDLSALEWPQAGEGAYGRAAGLAHALLSQPAFQDALLPTTLLAMCAQLTLDGLQLLAPQGAIVGMIRELAHAEVDVGTVARWLEDRAVPESST
jgi:hypothetical protein